MVKSIMRCLAIMLGVLFLLGAVNVAEVKAEDPEANFQEAFQVTVDSADEEQLEAMLDDITKKQERCEEITDKTPEMQQGCERLSQAVEMIEEAMGAAE
jgi:predicted 3-demethylubiquinone-9 3-methyltransferase (glyoxalase superfamily)